MSSAPVLRVVGSLASVLSGPMIGILAGGSVLAVVAWRRRPPRRVVALLHDARPAGTPQARRSRGAPGRAIRLVGQAGFRLLGRVASDVEATRLGRVLVSAGAVAVVHPLLALPVAGVAWSAPAMLERSRRRHLRQQVQAEAPDLVDLFRLAVGAGLTVHQAVTAVAARATGITGAALASVRGRVAVGERLVDALGAVGACGEAVRPLVAALEASERDGVALGPSLERVAVEARLARRRSAEEAARRLPVLLVFPLVLCILPAFVLLTVAPLLLSSLHTIAP